MPFQGPPLLGCRSDVGIPLLRTQTATCWRGGLFPHMASEHAGYLLVLSVGSVALRRVQVQIFAQSLYEESLGKRNIAETPTWTADNARAILLCVLFN